MNGDTAGLEPADPGSEVNAQPRGGDATYLLREAEKILETIGEYKAAREVGDAANRLRSELGAQLEASAVSERQRSREALHGQNPPNAEVTSG